MAIPGFLKGRGYLPFLGNPQLQYFQITFKASPGIPHEVPVVFLIHDQEKETRGSRQLGSQELAFHAGKRHD
jgi:hypothetical protein